VLCLFPQYGLVHISTGDLLRAEVAAGTEIGNKAKEFMNAGRLVPDEIVTAVLSRIAHFYLQFCASSISYAERDASVCFPFLFPL